MNRSVIIKETSKGYIYKAYNIASSSRFRYWVFWGQNHSGKLTALTRLCRPYSGLFSGLLNKGRHVQNATAYSNHQQVTKHNCYSHRNNA